MVIKFGCAIVVDYILLLPLMFCRQIAVDCNVIYATHSEICRLIKIKVCIYKRKQENKRVHID